MVDAVTSNATTQTTATKDAKSLAANYETFLSLLTAQIRNQDPLSPMDSTEWTNQLVQYSSVEQQLKGNDYLEKISKALDGGDTMNTAVNYIGKTVSAGTATATFASGQAAWDYTLAGDAEAVNLTVVDKNGAVVWTGTSDQTGKGSHTVAWGGETATGTKVTSGDYTLKIKATNAAGGDVSASVNLTGIANAAEVRDGAVVLKVGGTYVPLSLITKVS
ncbi:basal-body rod modification protein flgD [Asticcacaulis biprosthecium C19]|uniref:Basal-body rod modification protein FlgD n=1 Tax=Asticcacaulis biprosthecium C19 TaxID=715226 RepID=F4QMK3_9CAUL|nr:flagellar hook capping FlgD N-terminal domain-containing protein [Asticcacaulis biprosthecium]EGF91444.1 basal-body rod modification protein flgD [Asticcacaulis biprosthecium C19]